MTSSRAHDVLVPLLRRPWRAALIALGAIAISASASGVYAMTAAQASATQGISSGQLSLAGQAVAGTALGTPIDKMLPGETASRFVTVTAAGTVESSDVVMTVSGTANALTSAMTVAVDACSVAWTSAGACGGTTTAIMSGFSLNTLLGGTAQTLASGLGAGQSVQLRVRLSLAGGAQTTTNGVPPAGSYQNQSSDLTWNVTAVQSSTSITNG
jgi:hypothetical protein